MSSARVNSLKRYALRFHRGLGVGVQLLLVALSNYVAILLRFDGAPPDWAMHAFWVTLPALLLIRAGAAIPFRVYEGLWKYTSIYDLQALIGSIFTSSLVFTAYVVSPIGPAAYPRSVVISDAIIVTLLLGGLRMSRRIYAELGQSAPGSRRRVLIYGAGDAGQMIAREMMHGNASRLLPVGFIDDDPGKRGGQIHRLPVLGSREDLQRVFATARPDEILIAMPGADPAAVRAIVQALERFKVPIKTLPKLGDILDGRVYVQQIRDLALEDLLARPPVGLSARPVRKFIERRNVLVTGAGGSIGSELCRQILGLHPETLILLDRYENSLHAIRLELEDQKSGVKIRVVVGDVSDRVLVDGMLARERPSVIFHAAAHKHVPLMEENPCEAVKNNVCGTRMLAEAAERFGVDRFILISTDKAVNPSSVMGASKRVAELLVQAQAQGSGTSFSIVRFGNVLGSNGSVVPRFVEQIRRGGPVTVTHPEIRRFFMLIPEAVQLVLHAASQAKSGGIYVLEMGDQIKVVDVARNLIRLAGLVPDEDIRIEFTGLRPGEKLEEELCGASEELWPSGLDKVLLVMGRLPPAEDLRSGVAQLEEMAFAGDVGRTLTAMKRIVTDFSAARTVPVTPPVSIASLRDESESTAAQEETGIVCPACRKSAAARSKTRSLNERVHKVMSKKRLYRCGECGWRGWIDPVVLTSGYMPPVSSAPDLHALDEIVTAPPTPPQSFSPRHLG